VAFSLNRDDIILAPQVTPPQLPQQPPSPLGGYNCIRLLSYAYRQHINEFKTVLISKKVDEGSRLRWLSASTMVDKTVLGLLLHANGRQINVLKHFAHV
jgi:hypothetical protein